MFHEDPSIPTATSIRKSHWLQKVFEDVVWRLLCYITIPTKAFPKWKVGVDNLSGLFQTLLIL